MSTVSFSANEVGQFYQGEAEVVYPNELNYEKYSPNIHLFNSLTKRGVA